jgi:serine protease Do
MYKRNDILVWLVGAAIFCGLGVVPAVGADPGSATNENMHSSDAALAPVQSLSAAFEHVATKVTASVVSINSVRKVQASGSPGVLQSPWMDSPLRRFFGDDFFRFFSERPVPRGYTQEGLGTGVIVSSKGYILTNNHVVDGADEVSVKLADDRSFTAKIVGTDPKTDLAVLKIDAKDIVPANLGDSDKLKVGEWVVAVGNPFGLTSTITAGIVSAKGRAHVGIADYEDFIQTDAAINPGNSGGPLVDLDGDVVGINTAIATRSGGYMGVGFAVPSNMAKSIMKSLIDEGRVVRGWIGAAIQNLNEGLAKSFGYDSTKGVLVADVTADGPADKAGIKSGDIIVRFDDQMVPNMEQLRAAVAAVKPGTKVPVEVVRDGKHENLRVKVGELETEVAMGHSPNAPADLGMTVRTVTPDIAQELGLGEEASGVVVTTVEPFGPADRAGIQVKDVIETVQDHAVHNVNEFRAAMEKADLHQGVRLGIRSEGVRRFAFIQVDQANATG